MNFAVIMCPSVIPPPMYLKYFGIRVTDLERSLKFYTEFLGLKEVDRGDMSVYGGGRGTWVLLQDRRSGQRLELNWYPKGSPWDVPYVPGEGLDHIGIMVDDLRETYRELLSKGVEPTSITPEDTEGWEAMVKDPDGNWIALGQIPPPPAKRSRKSRAKGRHSQSATRPGSRSAEK